MLPLPLREIAKAVGAHACESLPEWEIREICTDSRDVRPGSLFVALLGERFDGHAFVRAAGERGACAAVVSRPGDYGELLTLEVKSTRQAFLDIAGLHRSRFSLPTVAVTGSVGKTTTREMIAAVLQSRYRLLKTENNLNNEVGVPKTLLQLDESHEALLLEFGMTAMGEIRELTLPARPDVAVVTAIGFSHVEQLGSRENIRKAKLEILEGLRPGGTLLLNGDNDLLRDLRYEQFDTVFYGVHAPQAEIRAEEIAPAQDGTAFTIVWRGERYPTWIPCVGEHNVCNALAGFGAGVALGVAPGQAAAALRDFRPTGMRQRVRSCRETTVVEDCYNANPDSMKAALATLCGWELPEGARRIAILGDMLELGTLSEEAHLRVGRWAAESADALFCCGELARQIAEGARSQGMNEVFFTPDKEELARRLRAFARPGDVLWFKASRGMRFEELLQMYYEET